MAKRSIRRGLLQRLSTAEEMKEQLMTRQNKGRIALVTGAKRGVGLETVKRLIETVTAVLYPSAGRVAGNISKNI